MTIWMLSLKLISSDVAGNAKEDGEREQDSERKLESSILSTEQLLEMPIRSASGLIEDLDDEQLL